MKLEYNDGGRAEAGYKGKTSDCTCRAIAIVTGKPYQEVYELINKYGSQERQSKRRRNKSHARTGVYKPATRKIMKDLGFDWTPLMGIGTGCTTHMKASELPKGTILVKLSRHVAAVIDGVLHDNHDCTRNETRCVYGYWSK